MATTETEADDAPTRVLLIEDDEDDYLLTKDLFADLPGYRYAIDWVSTYDEGVEAACRGDHDVCLLDYRLGARTGLEMLADLGCRRCTVPTILLTGQGEWEIDRQAMAAGAVDYLDKSRLDPTLLERSIRYAIRHKRYEAELERKVQERTYELNRINGILRQEVAVRARAEDALRDADRRKDNFLATLGHELRNPLAPIRNSLEILRLAPPTPDLVARVRVMIERHAAHLARLVDDLLDVSRVTRDKIRLEVERLALADVLDPAVEQTRSLLDQAGVTLVCLPVDPALRVDGDRVRLVQVVANLLNNAAKFTDSGGTVTLSAGRTGSHVEIRVRDTGVGLPPEVMGELFDLFSQVNRTLQRSQGGLGIGLALVRRLVEMHNGTVEAHSDGPDRGTEFTIRLPSPADE